MSVRRKDAKTGKTKTVSYGFVGRWRDGSLGWFLPDHASGSVGYNDAPSHRARTLVESRQLFSLCRITVEQVFRKDGRAITRRVQQVSV